ncbi:MAG: hypothetical protein IJY01_06620 [Clostridia bacterium]|nr:hypothetical protein [Clostridia bacterium]
MSSKNSVGYKASLFPITREGFSRTECISPPKPDRIFGIAIGDKTRAE